MCGIFAYIGNKLAHPIVIDGIKKLESRGYDSWGFVTTDNSSSNFEVERIVGKVSDYKEFKTKSSHTIGMAHTRWGCVGAISEKNTHPIESNDKSVYVVHNGIIENYKEIKEVLINEGCKFYSETDTEVIANFLEKCLSVLKNPMNAIEVVKAKLKGDYSFLALSKNAPGKILFVNHGSPLLFTKNGYIASESNALNGLSDKAFITRKGDCGWINKEIIAISDYCNPQKFEEIVLENNVEEKLDKTIYPHWMKKEIEEQGFLGIFEQMKVDIHPSIGFPKKCVLIGCGSSYNACLFARSFFEKLCLTTVEYASEFDQRNINMYGNDTLFVVCTQSGETKDTIAASQIVIDKYGKDNLFVITNSMNSTIWQMSVSGRRIYLNVGKENGVAATKTFTATCLALIRLATGFNYGREISELLPINYSLDSSYFTKFNKVLLLGKGKNYAIAREGALKLKEVAYIHAESIPSAEVKHGPLALIDEKTLCIFLLSYENLDKVLNNMREIKARDGNILLITNKDMKIHANGLYDKILLAPTVKQELQPLIFNILLQHLAYNVGVSRNIDVDRPRSISKAITVF